MRRVRDQLVKAVRRILLAPQRGHRIEEATRDVLDAIVSDRRSDEQKMVEVIQDLVDPAAVFDEIEPKVSFFSTGTEFEGGFKIDPLVKQGWGLEDFRGTWIPKLPDSLRKIRNALVHAREQRMSQTILPTRANLHKLRP
jgi:hypothetical protein